VEREYRICNCHIQGAPFANATRQYHLLFVHYFFDNVQKGNDIDELR
jgi:hypothetical protein